MRPKNEFLDQRDLQLFRIIYFLLTQYYIHFQ